MKAIDISDELLRRLDELRKEGGYKDIETCLMEAVERQLTELRRQKAEGIAKRIRQGLAEKGYTEDAILKNFENFRKRLRQDGNPS
jgi:predicted DNA-binding protein